MFGKNNYKQFHWSLCFVFLFSIIGFLVAIFGANSAIHFFKPVVSLLWLFLYFSLSKKTERYTITKLCWFLIFYALFSAIVTTGVSYNSLSSILTGDFFLLPYICLLYACYVYDERLLIVLKKYMVISLLIFILILINFRDLLIQENVLSSIVDMTEQGFSLDTITKFFCFSSGLLLLLFPVISTRCKILVFTSFALSILASVYLARRNLIVTNAMFIIMSILIYIRNNNNSSIAKKLIFYGILVFVIIELYDLAISIFTGTNQSVFFSQLVSRVDSDSRSHVLIPFYKYMDESPLYWIFGHGINAHYKTAAFGSRTVIETGYLQIIMKIGLIGLGIYFIILFGTVRKSFTGNILMQACSAFIVVCCAETIYAGVPMFGLTWVLLWICVGICHSERLKQLSNKEIHDILCK